MGNLCAIFNCSWNTCGSLKILDIKYLRLLLDDQNHKVSNRSLSKILISLPSSSTNIYPKKYNFWKLDGNCKFCIEHLKWMQVEQTKLLQKLKKSKLYQEINYLDFFANKFKYHKKCYSNFTCWHLMIHCNLNPNGTTIQI